MQRFEIEIDFRGANICIVYCVYRRHKSPSGRARHAADRFF
jgi:hypothetical protein